MQIQQSPYAEKIVDGYKYSKKVHGVKKTTIVGENFFDFPITYQLAKLNIIEVVGCKTGDTASFSILDSNDNVLNQHGFDVVLPENYYEQRSEFAGDVSSGMILRCSVVTNEVRVMGVNFIMSMLEEIM